MVKFGKKNTKSILSEATLKRVDLAFNTLQNNPLSTLEQQPTASTSPELMKKKTSESTMLSLFKRIEKGRKFAL